MEARARRKEDATRRNTQHKTQKRWEQETAANDGWQHVRGAATAQPQQAQPQQPQPQQAQPLRRQPYAGQEASWGYQYNGPSDYGAVSASGERPSSLAAWVAPRATIESVGNLKLVRQIIIRLRTMNRSATSLRYSAY